MDAVSCRAVVKEYQGREGKVRAVDGVDLDIPQGALFGFLGPNGAGKTTLMRMIYNAVPPTSGSIDVFGLDVVAHPRTVKARLGVVPQENNLDPDFNVEKNLRVYARYFDIPSAEAKRRTKELLSFVGLEEKAKERIDSLSGGMKRRLLLARGLLNEPDLLILDEPTTGLDPQSRHLVWTKVRELRRKGLTVLLTTHYMDEAERLCDEIVIVDHGRLLVRGSPQDLVRKHVSRRVIELGFPQDSRKNEAALRKLTPAPIEFHGDRAFVYADDAETLLPRIEETVRPAESSIRNATLEDVFLKLTGRALRE